MPSYLLVTENPKSWDLEIPGVEVAGARAYLTDARYAAASRLKVFNLCRTYGYQTLGYYVSLLAAARGHRPMPSVTTIQDLRSVPVLRVVAEELVEEIQRALGPLKTSRFEIRSRLAS